MSAVRTEQMRQPSLSRTASEIAVSASDAAVRLHTLLVRAARLPQEAAVAVASLLSPTAVIALVLGAWRLGADLGWTGLFVISSGLFSHWQVWIALAMVLQALAVFILRTRDKSESPEQN